MLGWVEVRLALDAFRFVLMMSWTSYPQRVCRKNGLILIPRDARSRPALRVPESNITFLRKDLRLVGVVCVER